MTITQAIQTALTLGINRLDAQLFLLHVLGKTSTNRGWLLAHGEDHLAAPAADAFKALVARSALGEPVAYLTGSQAFYGLDLAVDARVLVPRPDTETLVDWALEVMDATPRKNGVGRGGSGSRGEVLDLGTGSGAVALALKHSRPHWRVCASDASPGALAVARTNAARLSLDVDFAQGHWLDAWRAASQDASRRPSGRFDLIVSNPPYIAAGDAHLNALTHEPALALVSGADGLDAIRAIVAQAPAHLTPGGWLLLEHGYDQAAQVRELLTQAGFEHVQSRRDLSGIERCSGGQISS